MIIEHKKIQDLIESAIEQTKLLVWDYPMEFDTKKGTVIYDGPGDIGTKKGDKISEGQAVEYVLWFSGIVDEVEKQGKIALKHIKKGKIEETRKKVLMAVKTESRFGASEIWSEVLAELNKISN